jgi:hypothetical protein
MGNYGWSYAEVLPFFKKSENMMDPKAAKDETYHATGGPLNVEYAGYGTKIAGTSAQINPEYIYIFVLCKNFLSRRDARMVILTKYGLNMKHVGANEFFKVRVLQNKID